jgi:hypothetical protein
MKEREKKQNCNSPGPVITSRATKRIVNIPIRQLKQDKVATTGQSQPKAKSKKAKKSLPSTLFRTMSEVFKAKVRLSVLTTL